MVLQKPTDIANSYEKVFHPIWKNNNGKKNNSDTSKTKRRGKNSVERRKSKETKDWLVDIKSNVDELMEQTNKKWGIYRSL